MTGLCRSREASTLVPRRRLARAAQSMRSAARGDRLHDSRNRIDNRASLAERGRALHLRR